MSCSIAIDDYLNPDAECHKNRRIKQDVFDVIDGWRKTISSINISNIDLTNFKEIQSKINNFTRESEILSLSTSAPSKSVIWQIFDRIEEQIKPVNDGNGSNNNFGWYWASSQGSAGIISGFLLPLACPREWSAANSVPADPDKYVTKSYHYDKGLIQLIEELDSSFDTSEKWRLFYKSFDPDPKNPKYFIKKFNTKDIDTSNNLLDISINKLNVKKEESIEYGIKIQTILDDLNNNISYLNNFDSNSFNKNKIANDNYNKYLNDNLKNYNYDTLSNNKLLYDSIYLQNNLLNKTIEDVKNNLNIGNRKGDGILKNKNFYRQASYYLFIIYYILIFIFFIFIIFFETRFSTKQITFIILFAIIYPFLIIYIENILYNFLNYARSLMTSNIYEYKSIL